MLTVSPVSAKVIVQSPMSWCKSSTPPPLARGTKSLVKALIMVQEVLSDHMALPAQAKDEVLVTEMRVILHQCQRIGRGPSGIIGLGIDSE